MKKIIISIVIFLGGLQVQAQEQHHELSVGIGAFNTSTIVGVYSEILSSIATAGMYTSNSEYSGVFNAEYKYLYKRHLAFGCGYHYLHSTADAYINKGYSGSFKNNYHTISLECDYRYLNTRLYSLYSSLGIGCTVHNQNYYPERGKKEQDSKAIFDFQVTLLGFKAGKRFGGFGEAGFGYKGIVHVGVYFRI